MNRVAGIRDGVRDAEPVQHERAVRAHANGVDQARRETTQRAGVFEPGLCSQPCRSIAASMPHGE